MRTGKYLLIYQSALIPAMKNINITWSISNLILTAIELFHFVYLVIVLDLMCFLVFPCLSDLFAAGSPSWSSLMHNTNSIYRKRSTSTGRRGFQTHESTAAYTLFLLLDTGETHTHTQPSKVAFVIVTLCFFWQEGLVKICIYLWVNPYYKLLLTALRCEVMVKNR